MTLREACIYVHDLMYTCLKVPVQAHHEDTPGVHNPRTTAGVETFFWTSITDMLQTE